MSKICEVQQCSTSGRGLPPTLHLGTHRPWRGRRASERRHSRLAALGTAIEHQAGQLQESLAITAHHFPLADAGLDLYSLTQQMDSLIQNQLTGVSPLTFVIIFGAGLLTSLSPCTLSVLPLTIGYIGGYSDAGSGTAASPTPLIGRAAAFAFGLATTLALLGVGSSYVGRAYGQIGSGAPIAISLVAILMGLNLLDVVRLQLPSLDVDVRGFSAPPLLQAYLAGLTFALVASPCSTPILATLLAFVSSTKDPVLGGGLLLAYTTGYVTPLLVAATFTGALKRVMAVRQWSGWVTPASGVFLLAGGTYGLLSRTIPS